MASRIRLDPPRFRTGSGVAVTPELDWDAAERLDRRDQAADCEEQALRSRCANGGGTTMVERCNWIATEHTVTQDVSRDTRPNLKRIKCLFAARCSKCGVLRYKVRSGDGTHYLYANGQCSTSHTVDEASCRG